MEDITDPSTQRLKNCYSEVSKSSFMAHRTTLTSQFTSREMNKWYFVRYIMISALVCSLVYFYRSSEILENPHYRTSSVLRLVCSRQDCDPCQIRTLLKVLDSDRHIEVFCATDFCMNELVTLSSGSNIIITRLKLWDLAQKTSLAPLFPKQGIVKLRMGSRFPRFVHEISVILVLWNLGGHFVDINLPILEFQKKSDPSRYRSWPSWIDSDGMLQACKLPPESGLLRNVMSRMSDLIESNEIALSSAQTLLCNECRSYKFVENHKRFEHCEFHQNSTLQISKKHRNEHFGILSYDHRAAVTTNANAGDEIQTFAGLQFLPYQDVFVDRDNWSLSPNGWKDENNDPDSTERSIVPNETVTAFLNAWYGDKDQTWPPPSSIIPVLTSMHVGGWFRSNLLSVKSLRYLKYHGSMGARDLQTFEFLQESSINSYFSACATLLLQRYPLLYSDENIILVVDVDPKYVSMIIPDHVAHDSSYVDQNVPPHISEDRMARYEVANSLLQKYARAKLVITSRIHSALPCAAMGIPVIFVESHILPGGGGNRSAGLTDIFHNAKISDSNVSFSGLDGFDWENPPPNPNFSKLQRYRAQLWYHIRNIASLRDTAITFGVVPFKTPLISASEGSGNGERIFQICTSSVLNKKHQRSIENLFYTIPFAKLTIYSNSLDNGNFEVFRESGYNVRVILYSWDELLRRLWSSDHAYFSRLDQNIVEMMKKCQIGECVDHTELLKLIILFLNGGTFVDSGLFLIRSMKRFQNAIAVDDNGFDQLNIAFMKFKKRNKYIRDCIFNILQMYDTRESGHSPRLISEVKNRKDIKVCVKSESSEIGCKDSIGDFDLNILNSHTFKSIFETFAETGLSTQREKRNRFEESRKLKLPFGFHIRNKRTNSRIRENSMLFVDELLKSRCIFCSE